MIGPGLAGDAQLLAISRGPLLLSGTLLSYEAGIRLQRRLKGAAIVNPVLVSVLLVTAALLLTNTPLPEYQRSVQPLLFLLGPATVALALPLYRNLDHIRQALVPVLASVAAGALVATMSAVVIAAAFGGPDLLLRSIATKSVTAAISMAVAQQIGGDPSLAAGLTVLTGITGAIICTWVFDWTGVRDPRARGLAAGVAAHGIGTARMLTLSAEAGAFAGLAMSVTGLLVGVMVPLAAAWLER